MLNGQWPMVIPYSRSFHLRNIHEQMLTTTEMATAMIKPHELDSIPLMRFMPNMDEMSVGNIIMIENDVSVLITVFMLLLMIEV